MSPYRRILSSDVSECSDPCKNAIPPSPISNDSSKSSTIFVPNIAIAIVALLSAAFFLALAYYSVLRHRRLLLRRPLPALHPRISGDDDDDDDDESGGGGDHHAWYIRTVGLDESTIGSIGVSTYKAGEGLKIGDCSVCLGEFKDGELVRLLPRCGHAFHVSCIDTWLRFHANCPLCRAHIAVPATSSHPPATQNTQLETEGTSSEGEGEEEEAVENAIGMEIDPSAEIPESSELRVPMEQEDGFDEERKEHTSGEGSVSENRGKQASGSKGGDSLQKGDLETGSSLSSSGRGYLFSRLGRARSNSVLPL